MIKGRIENIIREALAKCVSHGILPSFDETEPVEVTVPRLDMHGDYTTNTALVLAGRAGIKPRAMAEAIVKHLDVEPAFLKSTSIAGPGFINFVVQPRCYLEGLREIFVGGAGYGRQDLGRGRKVQVEFVSANPTGPLHIGHGRGAVYGDILASIFDALGYVVTKEYYVNDVGGQMHTLGKSVYLRLKELSGEKITFSDDCYQGHYIVDIAKEVRRKYKEKILSMDEGEATGFLSKYAAGKILSEIKKDLAETGVVHDTYFHENLLHTDAAVESTIRWLGGRGYVYKDGGAIWFRSTPLGDDKDRVLCKSDGSYTYFAADIAYHKNKYDRGFDRVIDVWGADHAGYVARMKAAVEALGHDPGSFDVVLIQLVNLVRGGEVVSMSTRQATYETLEDVRKEVGRDVCRYFFLMRSHNAQLDFDLDLAKRQTADNPVFYIQYAHARIASIFRKAKERSMTAATPDDVDLTLLDLPEEYKIARMLNSFPQVIAECAEVLEPHKLAFYLLELTRMFQSYYSQGRTDERYQVLGGDRGRSAAKLYLLKNIQVVLQNALGILGISAPEEMTRAEEDAEDTDV